MNCTINCKRLLLVFAFSYTCILATAQEKSTAAPAIKTFALQSDVNGAAANSVNLFTGDVVLPLNLISLPGHNGLDVSVSIGYNSNVQEQAGTWNRESPNGLMGLGWAMDVPKIVSDYKQTGAKEDDEYYLLQGGSSNKLIRTTSGYDAVGGYYVYETKNYQFWKIRYYYDSYEVNGPGYPGGANKWVITTEDGTQYVYGDQYSGRHTVCWMVRWSNWMGNSSRLEQQSRLAVAWNLSEVINIWNEKLTYQYEEIEQHVGSYSGQKHTEASYLKQITDVFGRKVQFYYNEKDPQFYTEPHTEQAEPDAYQEVYEKKYLDHIDVLQEDGSKLLSVQLAYSHLIGLANGATKMLLASIVQKNAAGKALPGMSFSYYSDGAPLHGYLKTITYPTGGTVTYNYSSGQTLSRSNRQLTIQAPWGYAEPKVYTEEDYVVVVWRELNSDDSHSGSSKGLVVYVYSWVGEWKEQYIGQLGGCELEGENWNRDYKNFQLTTQKDFFALLTPYSGSNNYNFYIVYKSPYVRGSWNTYSDPGDYGNGKPSLLSGNNFVTVASYYDDSYHPCSLYAYAGDNWVKSQLNQTGGDHYYTGSNNYFISHNRSGVGGAEINFNYLTEDRKWVTKRLDNSLVFGSNNSSFWYSGNSMAVVMARNNPEFAYTWTFNYNTFFREETDKDGNPLFGSIADELPVFMVNNSLVGIDGRIARYDGWFWHAETITSTKNSMFGNYFSYGDDFVVRPTYYYNGKYRGARKVFNPNTLNWQGDVNIDGNDAGQDVANAGIDYYNYANGYYYRNPDGSWVKKSYNVPGGMTFPYGGFPQYDVLTGAFPLPVKNVVAFKNGEIREHYALNGQNLLYNHVKFRSSGVGNQTIVTYPASFSTIEDAYIITLTRLVGNEMTGTQVDYPVTSVAVNDGSQTRYTSFQYNPATAVLDVTGNTAQYNEVTVVPGSASANSRPYGFTKTYFNNGLTSEELGISYKPLYLTWVGAPYETQVYNTNNQLVSSSKTDYETYSKNIHNSDGNLVYTGHYVRPTVTRNWQDGIESITQNTYDQNTGLVRQTVMQDHNSKGNQIRTTYKYFWEQYDPGRSSNILAPVIQTKKFVTTPSGEVVSNVTAVTWKSWNNVFAPHKTYQWKKTGAADFDFTNWSGTSEPSTDWIKLSQVDAMDATGNIIQVTNR